MSNPTPGTDSSPLPTQPIVGIAAVHTRNTNFTPSQLIGQRLAWPSPASITGTVDIAETGIQSGGGFNGGPIPDHSSHWNDYFSSLWDILPTGKASGFTANPDPSQIHSLVSQDQNAATANNQNVWTTFQSSFAQMWRKGGPPGTYKQSHP